jgi:hypothetical protein
MSVARYACSRRSRDAGILRRSCVGRRQDPVADGPVALVIKQRIICVSNVRESKGVERVQRRDRERVGAYCRSAASSSGYGGAAVSVCGSLAAL